MHEMRLPRLAKHPYKYIEDSIRRRDKDLALVFNVQRGLWQILQECEWYVPTLPAVRGVPGVYGDWCKWLWVMNIWSPEKGALPPGEFHARILWALEKMEVSRKGGLDAYLDELDRLSEEEQEEALSDVHDMAKDIAREVAASHGRIISTPHGTINVDKMYERFIPVSDSEGERKMVEVGKWPGPGKPGGKSIIIP